MPPGGRAPHKPNDTPPARLPARRPGPEGVSARGKKNSFVAVTSSSGLARGVFCDGREEGEKEAPQSATSKSSPSHGRNLINAEWNTATVFWPFDNFPRNSFTCGQIRVRILVRPTHTPRERKREGEKQEAVGRVERPSNQATPSSRLHHHLRPPSVAQGGRRAEKKRKPTSGRAPTGRRA